MVDLVRLVNEGQGEVLRPVLLSIVEGSRLDMLKAIEVGAITHPKGSVDVQYSMIAKDYMSVAQANAKNTRGLFQYALALAASKKSHMSSCREMCIASLKSYFSKLPKNVSDYILSL